MTKGVEGLLARVEAATGPDRGLDWNLHLSLLGIEGAGMYGAHPAYTADLGVALALVIRLRPKWSWSVQHYQGGPHESEPPFAVLILSDGADYAEATGSALTPVLALLAALLRSLLASPPSRGGDYTRCTSAEADSVDALKTRQQGEGA